ncbi:MAG: UDP-N-acetylmuramate--L-alanine ligase [Chloroflexota bacterium]
MTLQSPVYLIGIGGSGMSAIARLLLERGVAVSGSDRQPSALTESLRAAGAKVFIGHHAENVQGAALVVRSSAVRDDNPEVIAARQQGVAVLKRSEFLGQLIGEQASIAVAGSHGKSTTTAMIAWMLTSLGQDPAYIIGGISSNLRTNAHAGRGTHFVIEADEYDGMFLGLRPTLAVVTNIEHDHPDLYPTPEDFYQAFVGFSRCIRPGGTLLACQDDPGAARLLAECAAAGIHTLAYGQDTLENVAPNQKGGFDARCHLPSGSCRFSLQISGRHNLLNALAALNVAGLLGLPLEKAAAALDEFSGTGRRFDVRGVAGGVTVIDDYAHHPTHIRATLAAARSRYPGQRIWAVWQPHTYSRTRTLLVDYAMAFAEADRVLVTEVYPAREPAPSDGFSARQVVKAMPHMAVEFVPTIPQATTRLLASLQEGDVVLVLSAGDADQISAQILVALETGHSSTGG